MDLQWPQDLQEAFRNFLRVFRFDFIDVGTPECAVKLSWSAQWGLGMAFPIAALMLLLAWRWTHDYDDPRRANMTRLIAQMIFYLPTGRVVAALKPHCLGGERYITYTDNVECGTALHIILAILGTLLALFFGIVPAIWFWRTLQQKDRKDEDVQKRYGFLYTVRYGFFVGFVFVLSADSPELIPECIDG